jgi:hypothetical protein
VYRAKKVSGGHHSLAVLPQAARYGAACNFAMRKPADWPPHSTIMALFTQWDLIKIGDSIETMEDLMVVCRRRPEFVGKDDEVVTSALKTIAQLSYMGAPPSVVRFTDRLRSRLTIVMERPCGTLVSPH